MDWACKKLAEQVEERIEDQLAEPIDIPGTEDCICAKAGLCSASGCPDEHPYVTDRPPREEWWECPPAPPCACKGTCNDRPQLSFDPYDPNGGWG